MAFGPIVKSIMVRMSSSGGPKVKDDMADIAKRAEALSKLDPTIKVSVEDKAGMFQLRAMRLELKALQLQGADPVAFRGLASRIRSVGTEADGARLKTSALRLELDALSKVGGGDQGGGGFLSKLLSLGGTSVPLGPAGSAPLGGIVAGAAIAPAFGSIISGTLGIIPLLVAATMGVAAFGAVAIPTFSKVSTAVTAIGKATTKAQLDKAWDKLPKSLVPVTHGVLNLQTAFGKLVTKMQPEVLKIFNEGLKIANKLLPYVGKFAQAAAPAILSLLKQFDKFASSKGFKDFMASMLKLTPGAILAIGKGIGQLAGAIGGMLKSMESPNGLKALQLTFDILSGGIRALGGLAGVFATTGHAMDNVIHAFGNVGHAIGNFAHAWKVTWDTVTGAISTAGNFIGRVLTVDIPNAGAKLLSWFAALPGKITGFLSGLPGMLVSAGEAALGGLLQGLQNALGPVLSFVSGIASKIASLKGPIEKDKLLLVPAGIAIMQGLQAGMMKGRKGVDDLAADIGVRISDKLMDAFMSQNDKRSDRAAKAIGALLRSRLMQIRSFILGIAAQEQAWASLTSAVTGPNFTNPHWIRGHAAIPGSPGGITFGHLGGPVVTGPSGGTPATRGHWAGGLRPVNAHQLLRNMRLDLGRLRQFGVVLGKLRRMGLDNTLIQQLIAAGPDQGFQIAEAILDAGRQEVFALDRTERGIRRAGISIGKTAARSQFGNGITQIINFNGFIAGNPRAIAREIQKLLRELRRANGGKALGFD